MKGWEETSRERRNDVDRHIGSTTAEWRWFAEASHGLQPQEESDVVEEARRIFEFMIDIVAELDNICSKEPAGDKVGESLMGRVGRMLGLGSGA